MPTEALSPSIGGTSPSVQDSPPQLNCHNIESEVRRELLSTSGMQITSLVVRRLPNGVCLQGVVRFDEKEFDFCDHLRRVPGVTRILNRMVVCCESDEEC